MIYTGPRMFNPGPITPSRIRVRDCIINSQEARNNISNNQYRSKLYETFKMDVNPESYISSNPQLYRTLAVDACLNECVLNNPTIDFNSLDYSGLKKIFDFNGL
jgi:hypothetical protein